MWECQCRILVLMTIYFFNGQTAYSWKQHLTEYLDLLLVTAVFFLGGIWIHKGGRSWWYCEEKEQSARRTAECPLQTCSCGTQQQSVLFLWMLCHCSWGWPWLANTGRTTVCTMWVCCCLLLGHLQCTKWSTTCLYNLKICWYNWRCTLNVCAINPLESSCLVFTLYITQ